MNIQETFDNIMNCAYSFDEEEFEDISLEAKDFISKLLIINQTERMRAATALYHPWMIGEKVSNGSTKYYW